MKHLKFIASACSVALLLGAGIASADPVVDGSNVNVKVDYPSGLNTNQHQVVGSDTLNEVMDCLTAGIGVGCPGKVTTAAGVSSYVGQGSGQGQRQMEGSPNTSADELPCTVGGAADTDGGDEKNPGCQEIAPMSGEMDSKICEDDMTDSSGNPIAGGTAGAGKNNSAESLAICADGIVVITDNASLGQYGSAAACPTETGDSSNSAPYTAHTNYSGAGGLRRTGTIPADAAVGSPAYSITDWKDVLRLLYVGCEHGDGDCLSKDRYTRCTDPVRRTLVNHWSYLVESGAIGGDTTQSCGRTNCADSTDGLNGGLRAAYRRDDSSGTSGFFLGTLSLSKNVKHRATVVDATGKITPIAKDANTGNIFCDGGDSEGFTNESPGTCTPGTSNVCPDYSVAWSSAGFPLTAPCPVTTGTAKVNCESGPAIGESSQGDSPSTCTPGAANACRSYMRDMPTGPYTLACPTSGVCPNPPAKGDPITKACAADDVLCDSTGRTGVVRALISPATLRGVAPFPTLQCTSGKYDFKQYVNASVDICPDGTKPTSGSCLLPYFQILQDPSKPFNAATNPEVGRDYNCVTVAGNRNFQETPHMDARVFNSVVRDSNGVVVCYGDDAHQGLGCTLPAVAQWRQRMATLSISNVKGGTIGTVVGTSTKCQQADATRLMGCVVGTTQCTVGFAGREVAEDAASTALQEPFKVNDSTATDANVLRSLADKGLPAADVAASDYVFARYLYLGSLGGFHNITTDCLARGGSAAFCADEVALVKEFTTFYDTPGTGGAVVCAATGFIALPPSLSTTDNKGNSVDLHECRSALGATANACGAPGAARTVFPKDGSIVPTNQPCSPL